MNDQIKEIAAINMVEANNADIEKLSKALVDECARLIDTWSDSGRYETFGQRLKAYFESNE